jgi:hypothetical protein
VEAIILVLHVSGLISIVALVVAVLVILDG